MIKRMGPFFYYVSREDAESFSGRLMLYINLSKKLEKNIVKEV